MAGKYLGDRPTELAYAVKTARSLGMRLTGENMDEAESIGILLDHITELEQALTLVKNAHESWARNWPAFAVIGR